MKRKKASSSRQHIRILTSHASSSGVHERHELDLNSHRGILRNVADTRREAADIRRKNQFAHLDVPSTSTGSAYMELDGEGDDGDWVDEPSAASDILSGSARMDLSYAGGELEDLTGTGTSKRRRQAEHRTSRRDQMHLRNDGFEKQMDSMVRAFMKWDEVVGSRGYKAGVPQHAFTENDVQAADLVSKRRYQLCLDRLESLIVARVFELGKMNMAKTGYKLRTHISKSLQSRSQAIRTALERYNAAANAMKPRRQNLSWDQVVEYAFLADFDLLRDSRQDHFKIVRAREEIQRLHIEIRRLITYIQDERAFLQHAEASVPVPPTPYSSTPSHSTPSDADPAEASRSTPIPITHHIRQYARQRTLFFDLHLGRLERLKLKVPSVAPSLVPGVPIDKALRKPLRGKDLATTSTSSSEANALADDDSDESSGDEHEDREADLDAVLANGD
ncbi:hypothetical protein D9611_011644 [Ephemerocybe angulata]|uniref:Uncharacterized protein n=1 Tax=Ephemerocybe angulata TaxID=980116 RepID=A0A8H5ET83_9AGAR|nr:hypothetical protein D9611_011644 [Tulosesus angulatus]